MQFWQDSTFIVHCTVLLLRVPGEDFCLLRLEELALWDHNRIGYCEDSIVLETIVPKILQVNIT